VIVDAVFADRDERRAVAAAAGAAGVRFVGFWIDAPASVLVDRLAARVNDASDATPEILSLQQRGVTGAIDWQRLDGALDPDRLSRAAAALVHAVRTE
jgi:predicted kinase